MASIVKRKSKYSVIYTYYDEDGSKKQKWETWDTMKDAKRRKTEIEYQQGNNTFVPPSVKTISDLMYDFVELYGVNKWALSTYDAKKALIDNYINPHIGDVKIEDATPRLMDEYYKKLLKVKSVTTKYRPYETGCVSARHVREIHKILSCAFNQAVKWELIVRNPVEHATLPKSEPTQRSIWTADDLFHAVSLCEDERLSLAINLAFSCSLRMGELTGLTWDCITVDDESIANNNASIYINKELTRASKNAMQKLDNRDVIFVFPSVLTSNNTSLLLKTPKTKTSIRRVWLPKTVAEMLAKHKKEQEELKEILGEEYHNYNLVMALSNGRPCEGQVISRDLKALIRKHGLPDVVFHSLRHTSTTYKLKLNKGDMKAVQGDTGHAQLKMVTDVYSHIIDEDRRNNATLFEQAFYRQEDNTPEIEPTDDAAKVMEMLQNAPDLASQLLKLLSVTNNTTA